MSDSLLAVQQRWHAFGSAAGAVKSSPLSKVLRSAVLELSGSAAAVGGATSSSTSKSSRRLSAQPLSLVALQKLDDSVSVPSNGAEQHRAKV